MEEKKNQSQETTKKFTYEELEGICKQLSEQVRVLYSKVQEYDNETAFKRLDYLFKILSNKEVFPASFVESVISEIISAITIPEHDTTETKDTV